MDTDNYIERLENLVKTLTASNDKVLLHSFFGKPVTDTLIETIKKDFFYGRESLVLELYRKVNGFQIIWNYAGNDQEQTAMTPLIFLKKNVKFDGVINFLPLEIAFDKEKWKETIWFDNDSARRLQFLGNQASNDSIKKGLIPIDFYSIDMSVAIYVKPEAEYCLLLQDYHADYEDSHITAFEDYLNFILTTQGESTARYKAFNQINGYKNSALNVAQLLEQLNSHL